MSDAEELNGLIARLDVLVPKDGAKLRIPADAEGNKAQGTLGGYRRLGVELLRAAANPLPRTERGPAVLPLDIEYLLIGEETTPLDLCEVDEQVEERPVPKKRGLGPLEQLLAAGAVVVLVALVLIGASAVLGWLFG